MGVLVLAVLPNLPGFINAATNTARTPDATFPIFFDVIYDYAWFIGVALASVLYGLGMKLAGFRSR